MLIAKEMITDPGFILTLLILHCVIGIIAANIAFRKGYNLKSWLIIGLIGGTPSLMFSLWMKPKN